MRLRVAIGAFVATAALASLLPASAGADELSDAQERARQLADEVSRLDIATEVAVEEYNAVAERLGEAVSRQVSASEAYDQAQRGVRAADAEAGRRLRALYMDGGMSALLSTVLAGQSPSDVLTRMGTVSRVVSADTASVRAAAEQAEELSRMREEMAAVTAERTRLENVAAESTQQVADLLAKRERELAAAGADVRRLAAEKAARDAAAAAARAQALLPGGGGDWAAAVAAAEGAPAAAVAAARTRLGVPYVWGATGPATFDCSGLTGWAYQQAGVALPRTSREQFNVGARIGLANLAAGDLLFWATDVRNPASIHHVGMYLGAGWMIHAPRTGTTVRIERVWLDGFIGATRPATV
jgi:cell wall-associated NlpC family hydrolase